MNNHDEIMEEVTSAAVPDSVGYHYQVALLQPHFCLNRKTNNPEVNLSEQSVKEHNSSLLLMIDSHHQH